MTGKDNIEDKLEQLSESITPDQDFVKKVMTRIEPERRICHAGTPKGMRTIITTGEVKGIILNQKGRGPSGFCMAAIMTYIPKISGSITGNINCWVSVSLSTADPITANIAA